MPSTSPVVLILGAGPNIGKALARTFAAGGYKVALAARSLKETDSTDTQLNITSDFSKTADIVNAFAKVKRAFDIPSVVIYNCSANTFTPADDPLAIPLADFRAERTINIDSAFVAAQQAVLGFEKLPSSAARTFIYTGNVTNVAILPKMLSSGVGKSGAAHMIWAASAGYKDRGYKFYYADERKEDRSPKYRIDGDAHAKLYWELAHADAQDPWMQTFVTGRFQTDSQLTEKAENNESVRPIMGAPAEQTENEVRISEALHKVAKVYSIESPIAVALAYVMAKAPNVFPIVGGRKIKHLKDNMKPLDIKLSRADLDYLESIVPFELGFPLNMLGPDPHYGEKPGTLVACVAPMFYVQRERPIGYEKS